ncbi:GNAT family N-acetyltransferase [Paenactinomyces guangxiensis]|uniref:GNAT family N-acetyltransferase n=1 Tax=Paenactinomyces guangxiensis TaxID=1490290 RepID=A0A7W1WN15_9BACL|nr:GNAT family N-acetyltransferase [Paenactinomyces guangxiensis]MBA4492763.1 GNAT family N-acetyltransferase [Paenactinomyces guangxiensis]MBH8590388.1 GNAT family N-acetyltransferase [Paenactinomyces guangxiensis]
MVIRKARLCDAAGIASVHVNSWRTSYRGILCDEVLDNLDLRERVELWNRILAEDALCYVAENKEGTIVGFASGGQERTGDFPGHGELYAIYLLEGYQRQGAGKKLLTAVMKELQRQGLSSVLVWVLEDNPSRHFYEALGGTLVASQPITIGKQTLTEAAYGWEDFFAPAKLK